MPALAVEVAQEVEVVVGGDGAGRRAVARGPTTSLLWSGAPLHGPHHQIDREREESDEEEEPEHASRVGPRWMATTLIS